MKDQKAMVASCRSLFTRRLLLGAALPALALAAPAQAQDNDTPAGQTEPQGEEVLILGERLGSTNLMEIPMAVQDISPVQIRDLRIASMKDLSIVSPTFRVTRSYQGTPQYSIRGIGFNAINMSASPTVTLYQDDIAYPYPFTQMGPLFDMAGVQILKGPQGTSFGRNTTAGVINMTSAQPTEDFQGGFATDIGNYETLNFEGFMSGRIAPWLKGRIAFRTEHSFQGWQQSKTRPDEDKLGEIHNTGIRAILAADPAPGLDITLTVQGWHNDSDTRAAQAIGLTPGADYKFTKTTTATYTMNALGRYLGLSTDGINIDFHKDRVPLKWANGRLADWSPAFPEGGAPGRAVTIGTGEGMPGRLKEDTSFWSTSLNIGYDLSDDLRLVSLSNFQKLTRDSLQDVSGAPFEILVQNPAGSIKSWSQELQLKGDTGPVKWTVGGYYGEDKIRENIRSLIYNNTNSMAVRGAYSIAKLWGGDFGFYGPDYAEFINNIPVEDEDGIFRTLADTADYKVTTKSLLANADWAITDRLSLSLGARYTWDRLKFDGCTRDYKGNTIQGVNSTIAYKMDDAPGTRPTAPAGLGECITMRTGIKDAAGEPLPNIREMVHNQLNEENFSWRGALTWRPIDEVMLYASASRGYKSGVNPLNTANGFLQDEPVKQEKLTAYEGGLRTDFNRIKFGLSGFYYDYRDKQLSGYYRDPVFTTLARLVNVPKSRAWGLEADLNVEPVDGFTFFGNALYLRTKILDYIGTNQPGNLADYHGSTFGNPEWSLSGGASFERNLSEQLGLRATVNYRWLSNAKGPKSFELDKDGKTTDVRSAYEEFYDIDSYGTLDGSITLFDGDDKDWEFSIWGRNLTQTYYPSAIGSVATTIIVMPGEPRTFGGTFRLNF